MEEQPRHPKRKKDSKKFTDYFPIFKRAPKLFWVPSSTEAEIVSKDKQNQYAFFEADFKLLETHLMGKFRDLDDEALLDRTNSDALKLFSSWVAQWSPYLALFRCRMWGVSGQG